MKGWVLEVLVVNAEGIKHSNVIGRPAYYVIVECGTQMQRTKTSKRFTGSGNHKEICWNEKLTFKFLSSEWGKLTHLKFNIMGKEYCTDGGFVGQTIVDLQGMIVEADDNGFLEIGPTPYNVVLEDDTYKGEIKIALKFFPNNEAQTDRRIFVAAEQESGQSICRKIMKLGRTPRWRFLFFNKNTSPEDKHKQV